MLQEEARWLGRAILARAPSQVFPLLDVASSGSRFRQVEQPWIEREIFGPIAAAGGRAIHTDMLDLPGVDFVGDLYDVAFFERLRAEAPRSLLCANLLEHVPDRAALAVRLTELLPAGGLAFVSVPRAYPYHAGPIDTLFRPDVDELAALFPAMRLLEGEVLESGTWWDALDRRPARLARKLARLAVPVYHPRGWLTVAAHLPWLTRRFSATCVVLQK